MADNTLCTQATDRDGNTIDVYENDIYMYLDEYIKGGDIKDMRKEPQSRWNAALLYINKNVFKPNRDKLFIKSRLNNAYNIELINEILDIYIVLCYEYDKEISIVGFSNLTGINQDTIYNWGNNEVQVSSKGFDIYKKLNRANEESLSNILISGRRNPVGALGALNRRHGWNMGQPRETQRPREIEVSREEIQARIEMWKDGPQSVDDLPD